MLKEDVLNALSMLKKEDRTFHCRFGIAGSIARGDETSNSDIDIVVDKESLSIDEMEKIKHFISGRFHRDTDVLCMGLLKEEDEQMDMFAESCGLPKNDFSVYKTVSREVVWSA